MSWRDRYLDASFRGVPFKARVAKVTGGRRLATHTYPFVDGAEYEDLGQDETVLSLECFVVDDDYFDARNKFENALNQSGPGKLVHPYRNVVTVVVRNYTTVETADKGGAAFFSVLFLLERDQSVTVQADLQGTVSIQSAALLLTAENDLDANYSLDNKSSMSISDARATLSSSLTAMDNAKQSVAAVSEFKQQVSSAIGATIALSLQPRVMAFDIASIIRFGVSTVGQVTDGFTPKQQMREQREIFDSLVSPLVSTPTAVADDVDYPAKQIQLYEQHACLTAMMDLIIQIDYQSSDEAESELTELLNRVDTMRDNANVTSDMYDALSDARTAVYNYIQAEHVTLPLIVETEIDQETNALVLSYVTYGNLDEYDWIVDNNNIWHPGFIPAGTIKLRSFHE